MFSSTLFIGPLLAVVLTPFVLGLVLASFRRVGMVDFPEKYHLTRPPLPYPGGLGIVLVFLVLIPLLFTTLSLQAFGLLAGVLLLAIVCFIDDRWGLAARWRLLLHITVALLLFAVGMRIYTITNPLDPFFVGPFIKLDQWTVHVPLLGLLPILSGIFTVLWLTLTINAVNWFDGIPGQVSVLASIAFLIVGLLALSSRVGQPDLAQIALTCSAIAIVAATFEIPTQRMVLGDTGSMFYGLLLGVLTIYAGGKVATVFLVLGIPLIDSIFTVLQRLWDKRSPFRGSMDGDHLHHRLLQCGWSPQAIVLFNAVVGVAFGCAALFLGTFEKFVEGLLLLLIVWGMRRMTKRVRSAA